jgi:hypothetical protein
MGYALAPHGHSVGHSHKQVRPPSRPALTLYWLSLRRNPRATSILQSYLDTSSMASLESKWLAIRFACREWSSMELGELYED